MKRIVICLLACSVFTGCNVFKNLGSANNAVTPYNSKTTTTAEQTPETPEQVSGIVIDPAGGKWQFDIEQLPSGDYTTKNIKYINANEEVIVPIDEQGNAIEIFTTSGFLNGLALVAQCTETNVEGYCSDWNFGLMRPDGSMAMKMQPNYTMPSYHIYNNYPAVIGIETAAGQRMSFPMWTGIIDIQANGEQKELFYNDRILVSNRKDNRMGFINSKGMLMMNTQYLGASEFNNGTAYVLDAKRGYGEIDTAGNFTRSTYSYVSPNPIDDKFLRVNKGGSCHNVKLDYRFAEYSLKMYFVSTVTEEQNNHSNTTKSLIDTNCEGGTWGITDKNDLSKVIVPANYDHVVYMKEMNWFLAFSDNLVTIYKADGTKFIDEQPITMVSTFCNYNIYTVKYANGRMGALYSDGTEFLPAEYKNLTLDENTGSLIASKSGDSTSLNMHSMLRNSTNAIAACQQKHSRRGSKSYLPPDAIHEDQLNGKRVGNTYIIADIKEIKSHITSLITKSEIDRSTEQIEQTKAEKAKAKSQAAEKHAYSVVGKIRFQTHTNYSAQYQTKQNAIQELAALQDQKTKIQSQIDTLNSDVRNKFTLEVQNQLRDLNAEIAKIDSRIVELNAIITP